MPRKHVNELGRNRRAVTALILSRVFGNSPDFWLNTQRRTDLWKPGALCLQAKQRSSGSTEN